MTKVIGDLPINQIALFYGLEATVYYIIDESEFVQSTTKTIDREMFLNWKNYLAVMPILRDKSSLTKEERSNLVGFYEDSTNDTVWHASYFLYLLSQGIDLFDWIPQGLAFLKQ